MTNSGFGSKDRIINAAIQLLWEQSYLGTSVDELCSRAEVRKGSFYHFFPSKTNLALAAIDTSWNQTKLHVFTPIFSTDKNGMDQLQDLLNKVDEVQSSILKSNGAFLGCPFGNLGQEMATKDEQIRKATQKVFEGHCEFIAGALDNAQQNGLIPTGDNNQKAINIFALFEGGLLLSKVANDPKYFRAISASVKAIAFGESSI